MSSASTQPAAFETVTVSTAKVACDGDTAPLGRFRFRYATP